MHITIYRQCIELPENAPRYVVLSHEISFDDGRKSFPLVLVNWAPTSSETGLLTLHASALIDFQNTVRPPPILYESPHIHVPLNQADIGKVIEVRDGAEGLTREAIDARLR